jgi:hypothetical protein
MAEITYRETATGTIPSTTTVKNAMLTNAEMDGNMRSIVTDLNTKASTTALNSGLSATAQAATDAAVALSIALG